MATLGGVTLPGGYFEQDRYEIGLADQTRVGESQTLVTNDPAADTRRYGWRLGFRLLTSGQRDAVRALYVAFGDQTLAPDATTGTFEVQVKVGSWSQAPVTIAGGGIRYTVSFTVEES